MQYANVQFIFFIHSSKQQMDYRNMSTEIKCAYNETKNYQEKRMK